MRYAVIAAGEGSRLAQEGMTTPKPLVKIGGECMVDRLVRIFVAAGAKEVCVVCNPSSEAYVKSRQEAGAPLRSIVRTTPSSMHSMYELMPMLEGDEPFVLTTVDTVFRESEFQDYVAAFEKMVAAGEADGLMGVTTYIDDEKPLYVATDDDLNIRAFLDADENPRYVSGGIYGLTPCALATLRRCVDRGESRMRNFQRALLTDGLQLKAFPFTKVIDVDHAGDIAKAEALLR
jgi:NDP-sugar pyrophosphorylase family protein